MDDHVGSRQIKAHTARLERNQEHRHLARLELRNHLGATLFRRCARELKEGDVLLSQALADDIEHTRKLAEQQDAMPAVECAVHELHARIELGASRLVVRIVQMRIATDLAQLGELGKHLELVFLKLGCLAVLHLLGDAVLVCQVQLALLAGELSHDGVLDLFGQIGHHVFLDATQHKRRHECLQASGTVTLGVLDRAFEALGKRLARAKQTRHQKVEDAPELGQAVFDGRARQGKAHAGRQALGSAGHLGERVFNVLGLVEHHAGKVLLDVFVDVAAHEIIRRHHHVVLGGTGNLNATLGLGAHDGAHINRGGKALQLGSPVVHERRGAHHKRGLNVPRLHARQNVRDHLQRFAQAHIVGQDAAKAQVLKRAEPLIAVDLVATQCGLERGGHRKVHLAERVQALDGTEERSVAIGLKRWRARKHAIDKKGARRGKRHAVEQVDGIDVQVLGKANRGTSALVQAHDVTRRETRKRLVTLIRIEIDSKVSRRKPARTQLDVEQVALDGGAHRELRRRAYRDLAQTVAEHDLTQLGQGRQALGQQAEQADVIAFLKRQAALVEIEVQGRCVHNAKLRHRIAGRNAGASLFERTARSTKTEEICRPIAVGNRNFASHKAIVDTDCHGKTRLGRHGVKYGGSGQVGVVAQDRQRHAAELTHLVGGDMDRRAAGQQVR